MQDNHKRAVRRDGLGAGSHRIGASADPFTSRMARFSKAVGNDEVQRRLAQGNANRDELLVFLTKRLGTIRNVQLRELDQETKQRDWWKEVTLTDRDELTKPDPTRWHEAARLYMDAADQLGRGALGQGAELVKRAIEAERRAFESLTELVQVEDSEAEIEAPTAAYEASPHDASGETDVGSVKEIGWDILNAIWVIEDPPTRKRARDPWWTDEDEEEEEGDGGGGDAAG